MTGAINRNRALLFLFLGLLSAFGPFVTDMYLPTLPAMTDYFRTTPSMVQLGLTFSMLGLALGQLFVGPVSDKLGRRPPLIWSMAIFAVSTLGCIFAPDIRIFLALRFIQGLAGAGGIVISRSVSADSFGGAELAKALAVIASINGVAPVAAPVIGGTCADIIGWRGIFAILLGIGLILWAMCAGFGETLAADKRSQERWGETFKLFLQVFKRRSFVFYVLQMGCSQGILFGNIASSPFIIQRHYGCSAFVFSLCFAFNSLFIALGSLLPIRFKNQRDCIKLSCIGMLFGSLAVSLALYSDCSIFVYEALVTLLCFVMGMSFTAASALALDEVRDLAGTGSAVLGSLGFAVGGLVAPLLGLGNMFVSVSCVFICSALLSGFFAFMADRSERKDKALKAA